MRYGESVVLTAVLVETGPLLNHLTKPCRRTVKPDKDMEPRGVHGDGEGRLFELFN